MQTSGPDSLVTLLKAQAILEHGTDDQRPLLRCFMRRSLSLAFLLRDAVRHTLAGALCAELVSQVLRAFLTSGSSGPRIVDLAQHRTRPSGV